MLRWPVSVLALLATMSQSLRFGKQIHGGWEKFDFEGPVPTGNSSWNARNFAWGLKKVYLGGSNEPLGQTYHNIASLQSLSQSGHVDLLISPVGSFMAPLTYLSELRPRKRVAFFDYNPDAIAVGKVTLELVRISKNKEEFISRIYSRDVPLFERRFGKITYYNQEAFMREENVNRTLQKETTEMLERGLGKSTMYAWDFIQQHMKYPCNSPPNTTLKLCVPPAFDPRWKILYYGPLYEFGPMTTQGPQHYIDAMIRSGRVPSNAVNYQAWMYGAGWLASDSAFDNVKNRLHLVHFMNDAVGTAIKQVCSSVRPEMTVLFTMDMFSAGYAKREEVTQMLRKECEGTVAVLATLQADHRGRKSDLCKVIEKGAALPGRTCSEWDSSGAVVLGKRIGDFVNSLNGTGGASLWWQRQAPGFIQSIWR